MLVANENICQKSTLKVFFDSHSQGSNAGLCFVHWIDGTELHNSAVT